MARLLDPARCAAAVRNAMLELSTVARDQPLRSILPIEPGKLFALMPGQLPEAEMFGAKIVSAFPDVVNPGHVAHRGLVLGFDRGTGELLCVADAGEVTTIRTAAASAVATDILARPDATCLAVLGSGALARSHIRAISHVRALRRILVWGRNHESAQALAEEMSGEIGTQIEATKTAETAIECADIICTVTSAPQPILFRDWVRPGTHINAVGSSHAGPFELEPTLVAACRYVADCRPYALVAAAEFLEAKRLALVEDAHIVGEIGEVLAGTVLGRQDSEQITLYKSLGHVVQDLAALRCLLRSGGGEGILDEGTGG